MRALISSLALDKKDRRHTGVTLLAFSLAALLLYLSLRGIDWNVLWVTLKNINFVWLPFFLPAAFLSYFLRALRWRILLRTEKSLKIMSVFWSNMAGYLANNLLPARAGELLRAAVLGKLAGLSPSFVFATGLVERVMDLLALVIIGSTALALTGIVSNSLNSALQFMSLVGLAGLIILLLFARFSGLLSRWVGRLPLLNPSHKNRLTTFIGQFSSGIPALFRWRSLSGFLTLTMLIWLLDGLLGVFLARLFDFPLSLPQALVLLSGMGLSSAIPSTPGYIGVYQFIAVLILVPFGMRRETALAFMLVLQGIGLLTVALLGSLSLLFINRMLRKSNPEYLS